MLPPLFGPLHLPQTRLSLDVRSCCFACRNMVKKTSPANKALFSMLLISKKASLISTLQPLSNGKSAEEGALVEIERMFDLKEG